MNPQSDTPETDSMTWSGHCGDGDWGKVVYAHWAQKLERERDDLRRLNLNGTEDLMRELDQERLENADLRRLVEKTRRQLELALDEIVKAHDSKQPTRETSNKLG